MTNKTTITSTRTRDNKNARHTVLYDLSMLLACNAYYNIILIDYSSVLVTLGLFLYGKN